jgi:curved DNA-binding protein CbpA
MVETLISMLNGKNYYQILQVDPSAEPEVINAAYKRLSIKYHPDTNRSDNANQRMQEINEAYQVLKDPTRRAHYDLYYIRNTDQKSGNGHAWNEYAPPTGSNPGQASPPSIGPQHTLANLIVSLSFPITYVMLVFLLFRLFRSPNIIIILAIILIAGVIAYKISARIQRYFRLRQ